MTVKVDFWSTFFKPQRRQRCFWSWLATIENVIEKIQAIKILEYIG